MIDWRFEDRFGREWLQLRWRDILSEVAGCRITKEVRISGKRVPLSRTCVWLSPSDRIYVIGCPDEDTRMRIESGLEPHIGLIRSKAEQEND